MAKTKSRPQTVRATKVVVVRNLQAEGSSPSSLTMGY